jgi:hypothetical protein
VNGIRIAGASGIFKQNDFYRGAPTFLDVMYPTLGHIFLKKTP